MRRGKGGGVENRLQASTVPVGGDVGSGGWRGVAGDARRVGEKKRADEREITSEIFNPHGGKEEEKKKKSS